MKNKSIAAVILLMFFWAGGAFAQDEAALSAPEAAADEGFVFSRLRADQGDAETITLGRVYETVERFTEDSKFKFELSLTTKGAAIEQAVMSEFKNRYEEGQVPLVLLSPIETSRGQMIYSLANDALRLVGTAAGPLPLNALNWTPGNVEYDPDGSERVSFTATVLDANRKEALRLIKTYTLRPGSYHVQCDLDIENLTDEPLEAELELQGPGGIEREGFRRDVRSVFSAYRLPEGTINTRRLDANKVKKAEMEGKKDDRSLRQTEGEFLWAANSNKYFTAILWQPGEDETLTGDMLLPDYARYYDPDGLSKKDSGNEAVSFKLRTKAIALAPAGEQDARRTLNLDLYIGPKDRDTFNANDIYKKLGFVQTIYFMTCCCPQAVIQPLAHGIMGFMKWLHQYIPNYGVIIIILVFLIRLILHPVTKAGQVSMQRYSKALNTPEVQAIRKKYSGNAQEMNRKLMEYQRERGMSPLEPVKGMLPMFLQIPIWISLWSSIDSSIELRGAPFLPFWITDLSMPDALISFTPITIPLVGWQIESLNLLPILMGVAFWLQQQLMPTQTSANMSPEMEKQQKIMKIMFPLMFPIMLYSGPSGVNLYIMASTFAGVMEQAAIRKHMRQEEEREKDGKTFVPVTSKTGGKAKKKKPKPFFKNSI